MLLTFYLHVFFLFPFLCALDLLGGFLFKKLKNCNSSPSFRWFFIHCIVNLFITIFSLTDILLCFQDLHMCSINTWIYGYELSVMATSIHFYHMAFFKLTSIDYVHHISSAIMTAPVIILYNNTHVSMIALFFLCGLPGFIDYLLLCLVKLDYIDYMFEKRAYVLISMWIRAPGCIMAASYNIGIIPYFYMFPLIKQLGIIWNILVIYINGVYFAEITIRDFYRKKTTVSIEKQ